MTTPNQWKFLLEVFPNEMEEIVSSEVLSGLNPTGDSHILSAIVAAEDVVDPARTPPPMGMEAILEAFAPLAPKPKPVAKAVTDAELTALKLAYADAYITLDTTPLGRGGDDSLWDAAYAGWKQAEDNLKAASRAMRKAGGR